MIRYREVLRLHNLGQPQTDIAQAVGCSRNTVRNILRAAEQAGLEWPLPQELGDEAIGAIIYPGKYGKRLDFLDPDYSYVHEQLKIKGVTRTLLYEEYCDKCRAANLKPCSATTFNTGYANWANSLNLTMHIERRPGQKMEVDWAGTKMNFIDRDTGELINVHVFVACLPFSGKIYAEGFLSMDSECWLTAHVHALDFYGGVPEELVPDNCKTAVISHKKGRDVLLNKSYMNLAEHYGCAIVPTRVRRPKDKANVEAAVGLITRRAIAALRNRDFFSLHELNAALLEKVIEINTAAFSKKPGSRASVFEAQERSELTPLPKLAFPVCSWERVTVRSDHHVAVRGCFYSVPFEYIGKVVDVRITQSVIEIFLSDVRIASHVRSFEEHSWITNKEHMPENHIDYLEWNAGGLTKRAQSIGNACEKALALILGSQETKKKAIGQGKALLALSGRFGTEILEEACKKDLDIGGGIACSVEAIEAIAQSLFKSKGDIEDKGEHAILRGVDYYKNKGDK